MADESHINDSRSHHNWGMGLLVGPFIGLVLYALSVCPVAKCCPNPPRALRLFYAPLEYSYRHVPPIKAFYDWYAKLWDVTL